MVKYCPSCGFETNMGDKFCLNCGADLSSGVTGFEEQAAQTPQTNIGAPYIPPQQPMPQQPYGQTQGYYPIQPKKSNIKLIAAIIAVIAVVVVVIVLVLFVFGKNTGTAGNPVTANDFVGTWTLDSVEMDGNITSAPSEMTFRFNSDGTYETTAYESTDTGTWSVSNGKLYTQSPNSSASSPPPSVDYQFSSDKNTLTLSYSMSLGNQSYNISLILKRSSSSNSNGGTSHELDNALVGSWTLTSMIYNGQSTPMSDITIDFNSDGTYESNESNYANETGTWYVSNGNLFFQASSGSSMFYSSTTGMDYQLSNGGNTLTFGYSTSYGSQTYSISYVFEKS